MKIQFTGHAGFVVDGTSETIVMDPWLSDTGAFDGAWFQFPCNHQLARLVSEYFENTEKSRYLYISHEHKDHFDIEFLFRIVDYQPTLLIAGFTENHFLDNLRRIGFKKIIVFDDGNSISFGKMTVKIFIDDNGINRDSAILVKEEGFSFLNLNDCKIFDRLRYITQTEGHVNVLACQFSGATWHPTCYVYEAAKYDRIARQKRLSKFRSVLQALQTITPDWYFPCAGPPCFLDPELIHINFEKINIFPNQFAVIGYLSKHKISSRVEPIMPGDVFDSSSNDFIYRSEQRVTPATERDHIHWYAAKVSRLWETQERTRSLEDAEMIQGRLICELERKLINFSAEDSFGRNLYFSLTELNQSYICVDFSLRKIYKVDSVPGDTYYHIEAPAWQIERVLDRAITWEDFCLTFRAKVARSPDAYDTMINGFLFKEAEAIPELVAKINAFRSRKERITVEIGGHQYEVDRYCPHQGADLRFGWCEDDRYWVCARHGWKFDMESNGRCLTSADTINAFSLEAES